ncbi:hypothetical protein CK489_23690 [Bradyrhizobium sp. UFLA03-84]|uniref:DUF5681 domain-containing protein n=1 Tax=Bradyrhizobium sp. UFLA03-84 TaxID=418599 RepID=UPI000BCBD6D4|nr:DUF5681 domain-containing protein [Bradyrhizobium sp. UFLA03-84]PAY05947.1 hypothetical protein CK489_23690 [Bradyrhizobium sp. UFLA03-84]
MIKKTESGDMVGYRRPPVGTRFKKGRSGNPRGRPKKNRQEFQPGKILQSIDSEELVVNINGKPIRMSKAEIQFRQMFTKAIKGDMNAARIIAKLAKQYFGPEAEGPPEIEFIVAPAGTAHAAKS